MKIKQNGDFAKGYNSITELDGKHSDMMMDFGILELGAGETFVDEKPLERVITILSGEMKVDWDGGSVTVARDYCFDDNLWCINLPSNAKLTLTGIADNTEIVVVRTENEKDFDVFIYEKEKITNEIRGKDTMQDCGRRIVRTAMDVRLTPHSNIMFGEDVHFPGRWAGFPSHHHEQPEIYYYKFWPETGFGLAKMGDEGVLLEQNDTVTIPPSVDHPQVAAPGYAMYFFWVIRHLEGNPYVKPTFDPLHTWAEEPGAKYWPDNI